MTIPKRVAREHITDAFRTSMNMFWCQRRHEKYEQTRGQRSPKRRRSFARSVYEVIIRAARFKATGIDENVETEVGLYTDNKVDVRNW